MMREAVSNPKPGRLKARYPSLIFDLFECAFSVAVIILLVRHHGAAQRRAEELRSWLLRDIQPEQLIKLASTLDRLSESDVEDLLAFRDRLPETGSSNGSSVRVQ
jgi:hypothetical protein